MSLPKPLHDLFGYIEKNKRKFIENLKEAVSIPSVSGVVEHRPDVVTMVKWAENQLRGLGATVQLCDVGVQTMMDGQKIPLPPVLLGELGKDPAKPTLCLYGHLDVQPAAKEDGWNTDPFRLVEKDGRLYGRGSSDDKGPVLGWLHAIEAYQATNQDIPVNIKFVFEGMEESGSLGLEDLLMEKKDTFLKGVDYLCISDNYWLGTEKPCITYGLRGMSFFAVEVECAKKDLHSGLYGGTLTEAMSDLIYILNTLVDVNGKILITGIYKDVAPVTDAEKETYKHIDFESKDFQEEIGCNQLLHNAEKAAILMSRWRHPSLSIHGIEGAYSEPGAKSVIPKKVIGKFSLRLVPNQDLKKVEACVIDYLNKKWEERKSANNFKVTHMHGGNPWMSDPNHPHYEAAKKAIKHAYNVEPDLTREGGSIPITLTLQDITGKSVLLLPMGACDDGAHSQNEKIDIRNYIEGTKMMAAYLFEVGKLGKSD
ncbi:cytosolic non-specific dipeptidase isoform X1 [Homalodisca vitripennis]|uniref:cytosolic non-specific dipeptidase isoform X1 n=1 Tax=Homalodisca vitripennis TaxID=197043 RepID=UPI001EEB0043|nr:cytosolic non-specific dipeptidase isoform X1 [Homalodisca vitripennis]XP_046677620.1 cytosolic non-specific dipeptidase isoform X1 [Homalodisca vitripennis]